jgi:hypothetical protein
MSPNGNNLKKTKLCIRLSITGNLFSTSFLDCDQGIVIESGACVQAMDVDIFHNKIGIVLKNRLGENIKLERVNCRCDQVSLNNFYFHAILL